MKTIRLLCLAASVALAGCAGSASSPALFVLDGTLGSASTAPSQTSQTQLVVAPVQIAPVLDERGIVYQTGAHRIVIANYNQWASPLAGQLRNALITNLDTRLTGMQVVRSAEAGATDALTLQTRVDQFMGHYDGQAYIAGEWQLSDPTGRTLLRQRFARKAALANDGYEALVQSLSAGWRDAALAIAPAIQNAANGP